MMQYRLSKLAKKDLEDIWKYTAENWSINQANKYYEIIINECLFITENQHIGRSIIHIKPLHRIRQIKSHIIVYKIKNDQIWVDRILHKRMDIKNRL